MKKISAFVLTTCLSFSLCAPAQAEGFFLGLGLGSGDADFDEPIFSSGDPFSFDNESNVLVGEFFLGYEFASDVFLELGVQGYDTFEIFSFGDLLDLDAVRAGVGYVFPGDSRFRIVAKAGLTFWDLKARESFVFNPGPEEVSSRDGADLFVEAGLEYRFNESVRAGLSLDYANLDFGSTTTVKLTVKFLP